MKRQLLVLLCLPALLLRLSFPLLLLLPLLLPLSTLPPLPPLLPPLQLGVVRAGLCAAPAVC